MTNAIELVGDRKIDLTQWNGYAIAAERTANAIEITSDEEDSMAIDSMSEITGFKKQIEAARKNEVGPFNELVKRVNDIFRPPVTTLESAEKIIKDKRAFYLMQKEKVRRAEEDKRLAEYNAKIEEERKKAETEKREMKIVTPPPVILEAPSTTHGSSGSSTAKKFWNYEVINLAELAKARPDLVKMEPRAREILAAAKTNQNIPGLRIFEDMSITSRS
jgi:hypothetical protein